MGIFWSIVDQFTATEMWVYGFGVTAIIVLCGQWSAQRINHVLSSKRDRRAVLRPIVQKYKSSFNPEMSDTRDDLFSFGSFMEAFPRHKTAVDDIMPILPKRYQRKLQQAWDEYCGGNKGEEAITFVAGYSNHPDLYQEFKKRFEKLHSCLNKLL